MLSKAAVMGDGVSFVKIDKETVPSRCKRLGRMVKPFDEQK